MNNILSLNIKAAEWYLVEDSPEIKIFKRNNSNAIIVAEWNKRKRKYDLHFKIA